MPWAHDLRKLKRAVVVPLHLVEDLDEAVERVGLHGELVPPRVLRDLGVEAADLQREHDRARGRTARAAALGVLQHVGRGRHQYFLSMGT